MPKKILVINGPNINLLGAREVHIYGKETLKDVIKSCDKIAEELKLKCTWKQSNHEGQIIDWIQEAINKKDGIIINPAAYSHTSIAIYDALCLFKGPVVEVHISKIRQREKFRHHSYVTMRADDGIEGYGTEGYGLALKRIAKILEK